MNWKRRVACGGLLFASWLLVAAGANAQTETGKISGRITDEQGAVLPGVTVTATAVKTAVERTTTTDSVGTYSFASMQPAEYEIRAELSGFRTMVSRTTVAVGAAVTVDVKMSIGGVEEVVQVSAKEPSINTRTQEISTTVDETQLRELPTITRNPYALAELSGTASDQDSGRGAGISLNGLRGASTNVLLDGAANNDEFSGSVGQQVPLDAVQEFSVISNSFSAQYGRATGGIVNVLSKSGTNRLQGSAYEFFRNDSLATNTFDNKARGIDESPFNRNQYGGSLGGPIRRDKAFFFGNAEYIRVRSNASNIAWVPTPQFLAATSPDTQKFFDSYHLVAPISGPVLARGDIAGVNPNGPFAALPADLPVFGQVQQRIPIDAGGGNPQNTLLAVGKVDVALRPGVNFYTRYALEHSDVFEGNISNSPWAGFNTGQKNVNNNILASLTNVWSSQFTTQSKVVVNRLDLQQPLGAAPIGPTLYLRSTTTSIDNVNVALPGYLPYTPAVAIPFGGPQNFVQLYEDATRLVGAHDLRFGASYTRLLDNRAFGAFETSAETLGTTLGNALDNLMIGQVRQFQGAVDPQGHFPGETVSLPLAPPSFERSNRYNEWAVYASDAWRPTSRLTVNLGLRYEYYGVQHNTDPRLDSNFYLGSGANIFEQLKNGSVQLAPDSSVGGLWAPDRNNFAPRVGFAWDVTGDGRTSVRGGYGIGYERNFNNVTFNVIQNPPNSAVVSLVAGTDVPSIVITPDNAGPLAGTGTVTLPRTSLRFINPALRTAYAHLWSVSFQRELIKGITASVDYTGSAGQKLYTLEDTNAPGSAAVYLGDLSDGPLGRLNGQYSNMNERNNNGLSRYQAIVLGVDSRGVKSTGLSFTARYTYGHAKDNLSTTFSESNNNFNLGLLDPFNPRLDYGDADYDIRHRLTAGVIWELPWARESGGLVGALAKGWQVASSVKMQTGAPFTVYDCTNGNTRCIRMLVQPGLNRTPADTLSPTGDPNSFVYLDLSNQAAGIGSYANPLTGTSDFGPFPSNMDARNSFRLPGQWNVDAIFSKRFSLAGARGLQVRVETYNLFNHANLFVRQDAVDLSGSTQILAFRGDTGPGDGAVQGDGQRRIQLGVRFDF
jgi:outer membrane receptor protein involved in Fe transport